MSGKAFTVIAGVAMGMAAGPAAAQTAADGQEPARSQIVRRQSQFRAVDQLRYQIGLMERVLETAVEHGASVWRDRLQAIAPVQAMLLENAQISKPERTQCPPQPGPRPVSQRLRGGSAGRLQTGRRFQKTE